MTTAARISAPLGRILLVAFLTVLSAISAPAAAAQPAPEDTAESARQYVADYSDRHGLPGIAYVIVHNGEVLTEGAAGDVTATTPMAVASVSKAFTGFAVLQLVDRGEIDLDAAITDYLPGFSVQGTDPDEITVRMLLSHTSGLPSPTLLPTPGSLPENIAHIADLEVGSPPGSQYLYSNLNYRVAAYLVEVVSGEAFDGYLRTHIFEPLGMADTRSVLQTSHTPGMDDGHVTAYGTAIPMAEVKQDLGGAGGVISTARDMGRWLAMQQRGGITADGQRLLSEELLAESRTTQPNAGTYGLGWQHTSTSDPARIGHDGSLSRYGARADLVPSSGHGVAVLLNSFTSTYQHPFSVSTGLIDIAEGRTADPGQPVATLIDIALGIITAVVAAFGILGIVRARGWAVRRAGFPVWRFALRLLPQLIMPVITVGIFLGIPLAAWAAQASFSPVDAFGIWPAAVLLVLVAGVVGAALSVSRVVFYRRWRRTNS